MSSKPLYPSPLHHNPAKNLQSRNANGGGTPGSLVCFLGFHGTQRRLISFEVTVKNASKDSKDRSQKGKSNLVSESVPPSVTVKLAAGLPQELNLSQIYSENLPGILVDSHGLIPATFLPILKNLQRIQRGGELTFQKWVLPGRNSDNDRVKIPPPAYARTPGFVFPLASIPDGSDGVKLDPNFPEIIELLELETQTGFDRGQCQGLLAALTREYALIQGPPGTGKSYVGVKLVQVLLDVREKAKLGPILMM